MRFATFDAACESDERETMAGAVEVETEES
jgi:hypothetical protein